MMQFLEILSLLWDYGVLGIGIAVLLYLVYRRIYKWPETKASILKLGASLRIERCIRSASGAVVEAHVVRKLESLRNEESEFIPELGGIDLRRHVKDEDWEEDGKVFIVLEEHKQIQQNLLNFCEIFVEKYFLRESRPYLHPDVNMVLNSALLRRLLTGNSAALRLWNDTHFEGKVKRNKDSLELWDEIVSIDDSGLLTRFLVPEYQLFSIRSAGAAPTSSILRESKEIVRFIADIIRREKGDPHVPLNYTGNHYGISITIVGQYYKLLDRRVRAHTKWVLRNLEDTRISDVFILAGGNEACFASANVVNQTSSSKFIERIRYHIFEANWRSRSSYPVVLIHYVKGVCINPEEKELTAQKVCKELSTRFKGTDLFVSTGYIIKWFKHKGLEYVDKQHHRFMNDGVLNRIARLMKNHRMFRDDLPLLYTTTSINEAVSRILSHNNKRRFHFYPETFLRVKLYSGNPIEEWLDQLEAEVTLARWDLEIPDSFTMPEIDAGENNSE